MGKQPFKGLRDNLKSLSFSDKLAFIFGVLSAIIEVWAIYMTVIISHQQTELNGVNKEVTASHAEIDSLANANKLLAKELVVLSNQLIVMEKQLNLKMQAQAGNNTPAVNKKR